MFSDFPLGNPCGQPWNGDMQAAIVGAALDVLETARQPRTTVMAPFAWNNGSDWRARYNRVEPADRERLLAIGDARRQRRGQAPRSGTT